MLEIRKILNLLVILQLFLGINVLLSTICSTEIVKPTAEVAIASNSNTTPETSIGNAILEFQSQHGRPWRRQKRDKLQSKKLGSKSVKSKLFQSKSGRRVYEELVPEKVEKEAKKTTMQKAKEKFKKTFVSTKRQTFDSSSSTVKDQQIRLALEMAVAQNSDQLVKKKELLKAYLYIELALQIAKNASIDTKNGRDNVLKIKLNKKEEDYKLQKRYHIYDKKNAKESVDDVTKAKRSVKKTIDSLDVIEKKDEKYLFGNFFDLAVRQKSAPFSKEILAREKETVETMGRKDMTAWLDLHSKEHPLLKYAKQQPKQKGNDTKKAEKKKSTNVEPKVVGPDPKKVKAVNEFLLLDAALDREARNLCLNLIFIVPMRNWAAIAKDMDDKEIDNYFIKPLKEKH
ncbi:hypothetical protein niasHT_031331 [Heterodera trifolii]|uniref:Uncharacterized protein n=1 Tax=Heterodera trifolii TaxID=157864 RepID=A0ABD2IPT6_9BILA